MSRTTYKLGVLLFVLIGMFLVLYVANEQVTFANDGLGFLDLLW